jgi:hypothetical protein
LDFDTIIIIEIFFSQDKSNKILKDIFLKVKTDHTCYIIARSNLPYIVCLGPYRPHSFVSDDASPHLSLTFQNAYDKLATNTLNKASYQTLIHRCEILQSTPLKEPDNPVGTIGQPVRSALIPNVIAWPNTPYIVCFGPYCPHGFVSDDASPHLSLTLQNTYDKLTISTLNKINYQTLTHRCVILHAI